MILLLIIGGKVEVLVVNGNIALKNLFILAKELRSIIILGYQFDNAI